MVKKAVVVIAVILGVALSISVAEASTHEDDVKMLARPAAEQQGIVVGEAELIYDVDNKKWEERVAAIEQEPADPNYGLLPHGMLYNKKYETVLLDFKEGAQSADAWVFVDKDTGDALTIYQEQ